jgi:hypothetical protein
MARLPSLVAALAKTDGRDIKNLGWIARVAREAGLITTTKRGAGAADMTARDAANLLICASVTDLPREGLALVPMVRAFVPRPQFATEDERAEATVFGAITRAANFGDALERAIEGALEIGVRITRAHSARFPDQPLLQEPGAMLTLGLAGFGVEFDRLAGPVRARMAVWMADGRERHIAREWVFEGDTALIEAGYFARQAEFDRSVRVTIGLKTLLHLCAALHCPDEESAEAMAALGIELEGAGG